MREPWRVFLDTSALIAGLISSTGAAREVLRLCEAGAVKVIISRQVVVEADRTLSAKLPALVSEFHRFLREMAPSLVEDPSIEDVANARSLIHAKDAPILAAAMNAKVHYLITCNTRHFQQRGVKDHVAFEIVTPGEFLQTFRATLSDTTP